ncbi:hypothetical protein [Undibacterium sp. Xuan67W]|uniref:AbiU2 domain-containing protein n=1 Tax=Undibacterium sp. Xuan67W TaxID=3413057 RepID=UPI003BF03022
MQQEEFEHHFINYRTYLRYEINRFHDSVAVYRQIQEVKTTQINAINMAPAFFGSVESSLFTTIVLWADKLFDERGERSLFNFLKFIEHNRKWLTTTELQRLRDFPDEHWMLQRRTPITMETIEKDREKIRDLEVLKSFRLRRDKFHGHFDKDYFFDRERLQNEAPIRWSDLANAGRIMGKVLNDYSGNFDGVMYSWDTLNINDLDILLRNAARGK